MSYREHLQRTGSIQARCAIITLSDTRTLDTDAGGTRIRDLLAAEGHEIVERLLIRDEPAELVELLHRFRADERIDAVLTTGGTGVSRRDTTIEVVQAALDQPLPGFGELFRALSFQEIGSGAMLSRALAGVFGGKLLFALPGSVKAVELAMTRLILPELRHLLGELRKG